MVSYQAVNKHRDRMEITRHNLTDPGVSGQAVPPPRVSLLSFLLILDSVVLITQKSHRVLWLRVITAGFRAIKPREHRCEIPPFLFLSFFCFSFLLDLVVVLTLWS